MEKKLYAIVTDNETYYDFENSKGYDFWDRKEMFSESHLSFNKSYVEFLVEKFNKEVSDVPEDIRVLCHLKEFTFKV